MYLNLCQTVDIALGLLSEGDRFEDMGLTPGSHSNLVDFKVDNESKTVIFNAESVLTGLNEDGQPATEDHSHYEATITVTFTKVPCPNNDERLH